MNPTILKILETDKEHSLLFNIFFDNCEYEIDYSLINYNRLFLLIAKKHRIINHFFDKADLSLFPNEFIEKLKTFRIKQKQNALKQLSILIEIKDILKEYDFIVLKGLPLSQALYNDFAFRDSSDVDILIKPKNEEKIIELLVNNGFEKSHNYEHHFVLKRFGISVEVHRKLTAIFNTKEIEKNAWLANKTIDINNNAFNILDNDSQYNYLLINGATHQWNRLSWVIDFINYKNKFNLKPNNKLTHLNQLFTDTFLDFKTNNFEKRFIIKSLLGINKVSKKKQFTKAYYFSKIANYSVIVSFYKSFVRMIKRI